LSIVNTSEPRRVVVTGIGLVTPLGTGVDKNWDALMAGRSGIRKISHFNAEAFASRIAGEVPDFKADDYIEPKEIKKMDLFIQYALGATAQAMADSGLKIEGEYAEALASLSALIMRPGHHRSHERSLDGGQAAQISPFYSKVISNLAPGHVAIRYGAKGVNWTPLGVRFRHPRDRRSVSSDSPRSAGCGDCRRRGVNDHAVGGGRICCDEGAVDAQ
jgi:3-oxoacyl-[acyl-carrier-protein] synthase II